MPVNHHNSSNSSEIWGDMACPELYRRDTRVDSEYTNIKEVHSSKFFRILVATRYGRKVMIKTLTEGFKNSLKYQEFLHKEFDILVSLNYDSVVKVYSIEEFEEYGLCIIEEFVDGITLDQYLQESHTKKEKLRVLAEILKAVDYIHGKGIIHRDIKPSNIIVLPDTLHIKLIDFGLADSSSYEVLKQSCGTEGYVSDEQRAGINDVRNDIYSLGCITKEMQLGWKYQSIINRCLSEIDKRPCSVKTLLAQIASIEKRQTFVMGIAVLLLFIVIVGSCWYNFSENKPIDKSTIKEQPIQHDTIKKIIEPSISQPATAPYRDYHAILSEAEKMIDADIKPINAMMDTVSHIDNIPSSYFSFLETESNKLNRFAESHRSDVNPSDYDTFYRQLMSYYKTKVDKWMRKMESLNQ